MMRIKYITTAVLIFLGFIILFGFYFFYKPSSQLPKEKGYFMVPDLIFGKNDKPFAYISEQENPDLLESNGYYVYGPVDNEYGVIVLHPISKDLPRYIGTFILLNDTEKTYILQIKVANIAGKISFAPSTNCNDNIFEVYLSDIFSSGDTYTLDKITVNSEDGWVYKEYNLNDYKGKQLYLQILSKSGGPCGDWKGEWGAIGYLNVKEG